MEAASKVSEEHYGEYLRDLHYEVEDSFLEGLDDHNIEVIFRDTIKSQRPVCGFNPLRAGRFPLYRRRRSAGHYEL